jgi:hypothetical protein
MSESTTPVPAEAIEAAARAAAIHQDYDGEGMWATAVATIVPDELRAVAGAQAGPM